MFFKKSKPMNSDEYERLSKRITNCESELDKLLAKFMSLRGLVHRKFSPPEATDLETEKNLSPDGLDELREANYGRNNPINT